MNEVMTLCAPQIGISMATPTAFAEVIEEVIAGLCVISIRPARLFRSAISFALKPPDTHGSDFRN